MRAAVYLRVSTSRQDERNQEPDCLRLCAARGWDPEVIRETGSGAKDRPGWDRVLELARRGEVRAVVIWRLDRIGRRALQILRDVEELDRLGCTLVSVGDAWLDTAGPARLIMLAVMGSFAQLERQLISERTRAGLHRARARGVVLGRRPAIPAVAVAYACDRRRTGASWGEIQRDIAESGWGEHGRGAVSRAVGRLETILALHGHPLSRNGAQKGATEPARNADLQGGG